jgi:sugar phosphate isomerase/epimerase
LGEPLLQSIKSIAAIDAAGVQFDLRDELPPQTLGETALRDFLHRLSELGLRSSAMTFSTRRSLYDQDHLDERIAAIASAMRFARQLKSDCLTLRIGPLPTEADGRESQILFDVLCDLARHGNHVGTSLAIAPGRESPAELLSLIDRVKTGPIGVDFDAAAFAMNGHDSSDAFKTLHTRIVHVQARDGQRAAGGIGTETALGRGEVDWVELLPLLDQIEYRGWITAVRTQGNDRRGDVLRAVEYLRNVRMGG